MPAANPDLKTLIDDLADAVGTKIGLAEKAIGNVVAAVGDKATLTTDEKTSLVAAINSLKAKIDQVPNQVGALIDDGATTGNKTWSSTQIAAEITSKAQAAANAAMQQLDAGHVADAMAALQQMQQMLNVEGGLLAALQAIQAKSLRVDKDQTVTADGVPGFTAIEQARGRQNLNAASADDVANLAGSVGNLVGANFVQRMHAAEAAALAA